VKNEGLIWKVINGINWIWMRRRVKKW
jgi:hypothetical protein